MLFMRTKGLLFNGVEISLTFLCRSPNTLSYEYVKYQKNK